MNIKELYNKYASGKGSDHVGKFIDIVSNFVDDKFSEHDVCELSKAIYYSLEGGHYNKEFADHQIAELYYVDNGEKKYAPYWTDVDVSEIYGKVRRNISDYNVHDFKVAINLIYSDNYMKLKRWFPEDTDAQILDKVVEETLNWLNDDDNRYGGEKVWRHFN